MARLKRDNPMESQDWLLSVATVPLLAGLMAGRAITEVMISLSQVSEEVFRGDRLPILHFTSSVPPEDH